MLLLEQVEEGGQFRIAAGVPAAAGVQDREQVACICSRFFFRLALKREGRSHLKRLRELSGILAIDLCGTPAKSGLAAQAVRSSRSRREKASRPRFPPVSGQEGIFVFVVATRVKQVGVLGAEWQVQAFFDGVEEDIVAQDMAFDGLDKGGATAFQAFEEVGATETHEAFSCAREVVELFFSAEVGFCFGEVAM